MGHERVSRHITQSKTQGVFLQNAEKSQGRYFIIIENHHHHIITMTHLQRNFHHHHHYHFYSPIIGTVIYVNNKKIGRVPNQARAQQSGYLLRLIYSRELKAKKNRDTWDRHIMTLYTVKLRNKWNLRVCQTICHSALDPYLHCMSNFRNR